MTKKRLSQIILSIFLIASVSLAAACSESSALDARETDISDETAYTSSTTDTTVSESDSSEEIQKAEQDSLQELLGSYVAIAKTECKQALYHAAECMISLQNIFGDEKPEMILSIKSDWSFYAGDYYFTMDESGKPVYMGCTDEVHDKFYTDGENIYAVVTINTVGHRSLAALFFNKIDDQIYAYASPELAEYNNSDALTFVWDTQMLFLRHDEDCFTDPEECESIFYCEDSKLYEVYMVSERMLDLTGIEIGSFVNEDGDLYPAYSYFSGPNYVVSRQEYERIQSKFFEMLTEVTEEPQISSGWIDIGDIDDWLEHLSNDIRQELVMIGE